MLKAGHFDACHQVKLERLVVSEIQQSGGFSIDLDLMRLTHRGATIAISSLPLRILSVLVSAQGRLVSRADLKSVLWPNSDKIDTERRLNTAMRALREALAGGTGSWDLIETIRGRGYRWIGEPKTVSNSRVHRDAFVASASVLAMCCVVLLSWPIARPSTSALQPAQLERFLQIAVRDEGHPEARIKELDELGALNSSNASTFLLRCKLAVNRWRSAPTPSSLKFAQATLIAARWKIGDRADIDVLEAELALGGDWDWRASERLYRQALAHEPDHFEARKGLAWLLNATGRQYSALVEVSNLLGRTTVADDDRADIGWLLIRMGRDDLARSLCDASNSRHVNLLSCQHTALARGGYFVPARHVSVRLMKLLEADSVAVESVRTAPADTGYQKFLEWRATHFLPNGGHWFQRAQIQAEAGNNVAAVESLEHALRVRDPALVKLRTTREFAALQAVPRFRAIWNLVGPT